MSIEDPDADRLEQRLSVGYDDVDEDVEDVEEAAGRAAADLPLDADPLDVADQHRPVPIDDDTLEG